MQSPLLSEAGHGTAARKGPDSIWKIAISLSLSATLLAGILQGSSRPSRSMQPDALVALQASPVQSATRSVARPGYSAVPQQISPFSSSSIRRAGRNSIVAKAEGDPTGSPFIKAINALQQGLQNSPLAEGKKLFAKLQAGDYDVEETRAKLEGQISGSPCIMYSFST